VSYYQTIGRRRGDVSHTPLVIALVIVAFASILMVGAFAGELRKHPAIGYGEVVGLAAVTGAIAWAAVFFGYVRRAAPERGRPYALILIASTVVFQLAAAGLVSEGQREADAKKAQTAQLQLAADDVESSMDALAHPRSGAPRISVTPRATGEAGEAERLLQTLFAEMQSDQADYQREILASGIQYSIKPSRLAKDRSLKTARASVARARVIVKTYAARVDARRAEFRHGIETSKISPAHKQNIIAGMDQSAAQGDRNSVWPIEAAMLDEIAATLNDLQHCRGKWTTHGEQILFTDTSDLARWRGHILALQADGRQEAAIRANALGQMHASLEQMKQGRF
jgi:hypothetical protein